MRTIVAVTGGSGVVYAHTLLVNLKGDIDLILSRDAEDVIRAETTLDPKDFSAYASRVYRNDDLSAPPASGSYRFDAMVVVPCTGTTYAKIATGIADNLITRAAAVAMKERRTLILVPRETPLSAIMLDNLARLARDGVTILPAMPGFYHKPKEIQELVEFVVGRILDHLGQEHALTRRWGGPANRT